MNMPAAIRITPATAEVSTDGGTTKHQMECVGDQRVAFKIKIKSRYFKYYKVSPAYGLMKPGGTRELQVRRMPGKVGGNYLSIYYITAPSCYDPRMPFVKGAQIGEVKFKIMVVEGHMRIHNDTKIGETVTDAGQIWNKKPSSVEDTRIEAEVEANCRNEQETLQDESALDDQGQDSPDQSEKRPRTKSTKKSSNEKSDQLVSKRRRTKKKPEEGTLEKDRALPRKKRVEGLCRKIRSAERIEEEARKSSRRKERSPDRIEQTETQKDCQYDYLVVRESAVDSANKSKQDGKSIKKPEPKNPNKHDNNK